jgi:hypothetical protein
MSFEIKAKKYRIELFELAQNSFGVQVFPIKYLPKEEFKAFFHYCKASFMRLIATKPYTFQICFSKREDALFFVQNLATWFNEDFFFDHSQHKIIAVRKECKEVGA